MQDDDAVVRSITGRDQQWLASHGAKLWSMSQAGYSEYGRGVVLVVFEDIERNHIVIAYVTQLGWPAPEIMARVARYDPMHQMVIVCLGQQGSEVIEGPRSYLMRYLAAAA